MKTNSMKKLIIALLMIVPISLIAQAEDENFYLSDGKISWQKSYSTTKTQAEIYAYFEESDIFKVVKIEENVVVGRLKNHATNPDKTGVAGVPAIVNKTYFKGDVQIQYRAKEKDYVVSFSDLTFVGRGEMMKKKEEKPFEAQFYSSSTQKYRPGFLKSPKKVYNATFIPIFEMK
jgi:hypothetical protein